MKIQKKMFPNPKQTVLVSLLRQNIEVKLSTQSAPNKEMTCTKWGDLFLQVVVLARVQEFFSNADGSVVLGKLTPVHTGRGVGGKNK